MKVHSKLGVFLVALLVVTFLVGYSCTTAPSAPKPAESKPIKIGFIGDLTGPVSGYGQTQKDAVTFACEEVGWELEGRKIELIIEDGASSPDKTVDKARKLVETDKVDVVIGPILTDAYIAVAGFLKSYDTPYVYISAGAWEAVKAGRPGAVFAVNGVDIGEGYVGGAYAAKAGYKTATTIINDIAFGWNTNSGFVKGFEDGGGEVIQTQALPMATADFLPYLAAMKDADACGFFLTALDTLTFMRQYRDYGGKMPLLAFEATAYTNDVIQQLGDLGVGVLSNSPWCYNIDSPENKAFIAAFEKWAGRPPDHSLESYYQAVQLFMEAVRMTKGDTSPEAIIKAIHSIDKVFARGRVTVDSDGWVQGTQYICKIVNKGAPYGYVFEQFDTMPRPVIR